MAKKKREYLVVDIGLNDYEAVESFVEKLTGIIKSGQKRIIINFIDDTELDAHFLRAVYRFLRWARTRLASVRIVTPSSKMKEIFYLTRLESYARVYDSIEEAKKEGGVTSLMRYAGIGATAAFLLLYRKIFKWLVFSWQVDPYYSHGFLVLIVSCYLLWRKRHEIKNPVLSFSPIGICLLIICAAMYFVGYDRSARFLIAFSGIFYLLGNVRILLGKNIFRQALFPVALFAFSIPLPRLDEAASYLQHFTADWVTRIVSGLGIEAYNIGIRVFFRDISVSIDAPCSGLRSLIALLFVGTLFVSMLKANPVRKMILFGLIAPISVIANLSRVALLVLIANSYGLKIAMIYFHNFAGILLFVLALGMLFIGKIILRCGWERL